MLHEAWQRKKSLASNISNQEIDLLYVKGLQAGAWGGKICGAGGGGCLLFFAPPERRQEIRKVFANLVEIPVRFTNRGCEIIFSDRRQGGMT
jgi:D-glycero-alpha-D-manno-heptose-7-phosphate kinase